MAFGVVALGILAAVWLNMAKLKMGMGQPEHDISQVPIARNLTSDQIEALRNGKPLPLVLADQPTYQPLAGNASSPPAQPNRNLQSVPEPQFQTTTAFTKPDPDAGSHSEESGSKPAPVSLPQTQPVEQDEKRGYMEATVSLSSDSPTDRVAAVGWSSDPAGTQFAPRSVPRSNPVTDANGHPTGSSFVEKFPGQSGRLPNLQAGPAMKEPTPALVPEPISEQTEIQLPKSSQLTPPPFGDFTLSEPKPTGAATRQSELPTDSAVKPTNFNAPLKTGLVPSTFSAHPAAAPTEVAYRTHITREGDTWWSLAQQIYDDGNRFRELYSVNRDRVPGYDRIPSGTEIICPPLEELSAKTKPSPAIAERTAGSARTYLTQPGDTLFGIARHQLGQASRFGELLRLNRERLPEGTGHLSPLPQGTQLVFPAR